MDKNRHTTRYKEYDYSKPGFYFITICTHNKKDIFGKIKDIEINDNISEPEMILNDTGKIVNEEIINAALIRKEIRIDNFVIMPNHIHVIVEILSEEYVGANGNSPLSIITPKNDYKRANCRLPLQNKMKPKSISSFVSGFKASVTRRMKKISNDENITIWQRNYFDRIIRNDVELNKIRDYVISNPSNFKNDMENIYDEIIRL